MFTAGSYVATWLTCFLVSSFKPLRGLLMGRLSLSISLSLSLVPYKRRLFGCRHNCGARESHPRSELFCLSEAVNACWRTHNAGQGCEWYSLCTYTGMDDYSRYLCIPRYMAIQQVRLREVSWKKRRRCWRTWRWGKTWWEIDKVQGIFSSSLYWFIIFDLFIFCTSLGQRVDDGAALDVGNSVGNSVGICHCARREFHGDFYHT